MEMLGLIMNQIHTIYGEQSHYIEPAITPIQY